MGAPDRNTLILVAWHALIVRDVIGAKPGQIAREALAYAESMEKALAAQEAP